MDESRAARQPAADHVAAAIKHLDAALATDHADPQWSAALAEAKAAAITARLVG